VVKRRDTSLHDTDAQGREPCRGADLRQRRDPQGSGGVVPKLRVAAATGLESNSSRRFPGESYDANGNSATWVVARDKKTSAGGEDKGYFALGAGDAGSNPAAGLPASSKRKDAYVPLLLIPRLNSTHDSGK